MNKIHKINDGKVVYQMFLPRHQFGELMDNVCDGVCKLLGNKRCEDCDKDKRIIKINHKH